MKTNNSINSHHLIDNEIVLASLLKNGKYIYNNNITNIPILTLKETLSLKLLKKFDIVVSSFFN